MNEAKDGILKYQLGVKRAAEEKQGRKEDGDHKNTVIQKLKQKLQDDGHQWL